MTKLSVNLNKIALIRNSREGNYPDLLHFAKTAVEAGADGITVHPRPDQRHIRPNDTRQLAAFMKAYPALEFNVEGNPFAPAHNDYPGFIALVEETRPHQCTLVPDSDDQLTSDHGFNLQAAGDKLAPLIARLKQAGMRVSLFMDPDLQQIELAKQLGADRIELYTGPYAAAWNNPEVLEPLFRSYDEAARHATALGLGVNAGHDLNLDNLGRFIGIPGILEVSIGHALTVDALNLGFAQAVRRYKDMLI